MKVVADSMPPAEPGGRGGSLWLALLGIYVI